MATIAAGQQGLVTVDDARDLGIDPHRLVDMERRGTIQRVARGVYRFPLLETRPDLRQLTQAFFWTRKRGVLSHETALDLHELGDINPVRVHMTIPKGFRLQTKERPKLYKLHRGEVGPREQALYEGLPIVTPERAIRDGIESGVRTDLLRQAIDTAKRRGLVRRPALQRLRRDLEVRGRSG